MFIIERFYSCVSNASVLALVHVVLLVVGPAEWL